MILIALLYGWREVQQGQLAYRPQGTRNALLENPVVNTGTLVLDVNVPARVVIDEHFRGLVPGSRPFSFSLEPGTHTVSIQADGYGEQKFTLALEAGKTVHRTVSLPPVAPNVPNALVGPKEFIRAVKNARDGASIALEPGEYRLPEGLTITRSITLIGAGRDKTRIVSDAELFVVKFDAQGSLAASDLSFIHDGTGKADVVVIENGSFSFERCGFSGGIRNPEKDATTGDGLWVRDNARGRITDSLFSGNGLHGLEIQGSASLTLDGNTFERNKEDGFVFFDDSTGMARNNTSRENGLHGVSVAERANPTLEGNVLENNKEVGLRYSGTASGTARLNIARNNGLSGLTVNDSARPTLTGNVLRENGSYGLYIARDARPILQKNITKNNKKGDLEDLRPAQIKP